MRDSVLKRVCCSVVTVALVVALAACGDQESTTEPEKSNTKASELLPAKIQESGVLRVGTSPDFEPAEFYKPGTKEITGYDPELIEAIAEALGVTVEFVAVSYDGLVPGLQSDRFDVVVSGLTDTAEREEQVTFVDYMQHYQVFVTKADNPHGVTGDMLSACGLKLAAEKGSITVDYAETVTTKCQEAGKPAPKIVPLDNQNATTLAIRSGQVDVGFRSPLSLPVLQKATNDAFVAFRVDEIPTVLLGMAVVKGNDELAEAILSGLKQIQEDGTYLEILKKWGVEDVAFDQPGINIAVENPDLIPG